MFNFLGHKFCFRFVFVFGLIFSLTTSAAERSELIKSVLEKQEACSNFIRYDDKNVFLGFGPYKIGFEEPREPIPALVRVVPLDGSPFFDLPTNDSTIDAVTYKGRLFLLTYSSIEEWDLDTKQVVGVYPTSLHAGPLEYKQHAMHFALAGDKLIIAHGRLGATIFDLKSKKITREFAIVPFQFPKESTVTGVSVIGGKAYFVVDSFTLVAMDKPPFRGIITMDVASEKIINRLDGLDVGVESVVTEGKKLVTSFGRILWKYNVASLQGKKLPEPEIRIWQYDMRGGPTGAAAMDDKYYYTCFDQAPSNPGEPFKQIPRALDRRIFILD